MKLNPLKCTFNIESDKFLSYMVFKSGIEMNLDKVQTIKQMEPPKTVKDVQCLIGHLVALHMFVAKSTKIYLLFFKLLRNPKDF